MPSKLESYGNSCLLRGLRAQLPTCPYPDLKGAAEAAPLVSMSVQSLNRTDT